MRHYAGLDVSVKETSVCIIDESGKVCRETKVPSHPEDLARALGPAAGGHLASHLGERHGFPLDKGSAIDLTRTVP